MFGLGLVRCEMAKGEMLPLRWMVPHNEGLTGSTVYVARHILLSVCTSVCECLAVCDFLYLTMDMCALMWLSV